MRRVCTHPLLGKYINFLYPISELFGVVWNTCSWLDPSRSYESKRTTLRTHCGKFLATPLCCVETHVDRVEACRTWRVHSMSMTSLTSLAANGSAKRLLWTIRLLFCLLVHYVTLWRFCVAKKRRWHGSEWKYINRIRRLRGKWQYCDMHPWIWARSRQHMSCRVVSCRSNWNLSYSLCSAACRCLTTSPCRRITVIHEPSCFGD